MKTCALLAALLIPAISPAQPATPAAKVPTDEAGFVAYMAERLQQRLPGYQFRISGQSLWGQRQNGDPLGQLDPMPVYRYCQNNPALCEAQIGQYADTVAELARTQNLQPTSSQLRLTLRPLQFVEEVQRQPRRDGAPRIYAREMLPGLMVVPVLDFQNSLRFVGASEMRQLGLDENQMYETAALNMRSSMLPLPGVAHRPANGGYGILDGEDFTASRILMHQDWAALAAQYNGQLMVMVPTTNVLLYGHAANPLEQASMQCEARKVYRNSPRPLSLDMLRWSATGWEIVPAGPELPRLSGTPCGR